MAIPKPDRRDDRELFRTDERASLEGWLDYHRDTLALKCSGLTDEQLRERAVPPSTLTLVGLIRHMTEVERGWFSRTLEGAEAPPLYCSEANPDGDFDDVDRQDPAEAYRLWKEECERSRRNAATVQSLDQPAKRRRLPEDRAPSFRWIMTHMIEEYARHNGHADLLRQRIDGSVGD
ncbi:MAG TPA: DinB family protein [Chloroflexota bacterium]|nr:DinB family protein [Chloroflexota bacterium]